MLSKPWDQRKPAYDFVIVGSGYGGAIAAARLATANLNPKPSVCILERGREWEVGKFPDSASEALRERRSELNPLGLYEFLNYRDISVIKGSGLGGTSLINANVAIVPDAEVFRKSGWPASLTLESLRPYYERAKNVLGARPHPRAAELLKVQALARRGRQLGIEARALDITVNFDRNGANPYGVPQKPCIDCGDCVTGCNVGAKNTLYMNYLPMARNGGAEIFTQTKVEWIEKLDGGGWRIHGRHYPSPRSSRKFTLDAGNVILAAGAVNTTEILMRSEMHGLKVSPALGTGFTGNGDFFGLAYNSDYQTNVLGFGNRPDSPRAAIAPGPTIVGVLRYNGSRDVDLRFTIEDLSFPSAYVAAAKAAFAALRGEDTDAGDELEERGRVLRDLNPFNPDDPHGAMNHTMLYLCMGFDDAKGTMEFDAPWFEKDGRLSIVWDDVGRQVVFTRINEELRRHSRALGASFIENPLWTIFDQRHLITAHPLGGCPLGEDYMQGAVDEFGRVFSGDGSVHQGLFVCDGSLMPTALGVNPFLTISALAERIAERLVRARQGEAYPQPKVSVGFRAIDAREVITWPESELEKLFRRAPTMGIDVMVNSGQRKVDPAAKTIRNDAYWKGFFPKGHVLNDLSALLFTAFKKEFFKKGRQYAGITSDTDGRIRARNTLKEIELKQRRGDLAPGRYILLTYDDPPWQGYYDVFKVINEDLLLGRVYLGVFPRGLRLFTFPMTRVYGFDQMTVEDHRQLWEQASAPAKEELHGVWRMDAISNANHAGSLAYLKFDLKPDGRLEARYQLLGLLEGLVTPSFVANHFQLHDFTPFHDEIRKLDADLMIGKYVMTLPPGAAALIPAASLGLLHTEEAGGAKRFGFYYLLSRAQGKEMPANRLIRPFLDTHLPSGLGLTFDEKMVGWWNPGGPPAWDGRSEKSADLSFKVRMTVGDINEFIEGAAHEARVSGTITFGRFEDAGPVTFPLDERRSLFNYLRVNEATKEAEMRYHLEFQSPEGRRFTLEGRKYMQKDDSGGVRAMQEVLEDYTTLFCHIYEDKPEGRSELGTGYLKFRTFEDLAAVRNLTDFLGSFRVTNTSDPLLQLQAQLRFLAFTTRFVMQEYDPLAPAPGILLEDVRAAVLRGADAPDFFSTRPTAELQAILRDSPGLPLQTLVNTGEVRIDFDKKRIFRDSFWKGSFARDSVLGWEERVRTAGLGGAAAKSGAAFAGGSFWKRFDRVEDGRAIGHVVNYELHSLPGKPEVREVPYPNNDRRYFRQGDKVLLLTYLNQPYKIVYDTIKVIDRDSAIGVMHLGDFPHGIEFATFVMERHNYPFEKMSVEDHHRIFADPRVSAPTAAQLAGDWEGHLVFLTQPNISLLNQANPVVFRLQFRQAGRKMEGRYRLGLLRGEMDVQFTDEFVRLDDFTTFHDEIRAIDENTLIGKWVSPELSPILLAALEDYIEPGEDRFAFYYVLSRK